jgi:GTPase SAR1 family protein
MLYFDHQSDGVELFEDKELEDYGWNASALEINYRQISEFIEESCEGILLCYDNEIQFSGFVIVNDINEVKTKVKEFIVNKAKENLEEELFDTKDDDVIEALEFFGIKA